jgi:hypothetical protein
MFRTTGGDSLRHRVYEWLATSSMDLRSMVPRPAGKAGLGPERTGRVGKRTIIR